MDAFAYIDTADTAAGTIDSPSLVVVSFTMIVNLSVDKDKRGGDGWGVQYHTWQYSTQHSHCIAASKTMYVYDDYYIASYRSSIDMVLTD